MLYKEEHIFMLLSIAFLFCMPGDHTIYSSIAVCHLKPQSIKILNCFMWEKICKLVWTYEKHFWNMFTSSFIINIVHINLTSFECQNVYKPRITTDMYKFTLS